MSIKESISDLAHAINNLQLETTPGDHIDWGDSSEFNDNENNMMKSEESDVRAANDCSPIEVADEFHKFERRMNGLDKQLQFFSNAARTIGGSVNILSSVRHLRSRLTGLLYLFRLNAVSLLSRNETHPEPYQTSQSSIVIQSQDIREALHNLTRPTVESEGDLSPEQLPEQFDLLANDVKNLLDYLDSFPHFGKGFVDTTPIRSFEEDLRYWGDCLKDYKGNFDHVVVQQYLHDLTTETGGLGERMDTIIETISYFTEIGIPAIYVDQQQGAITLQNLTTVATLFSAVTATTIQFSYQNTKSSSAQAVNSFWFSSLVFSIASVVNSLVNSLFGFTLKQAMYRPTAYKAPWWMLIWIERSPLVFLVIAIACFSVGLVLFTYTSNQDSITCIATVVFTGFSSFSLIVISALFASENWTSSKFQSQNLVTDVVDTPHSEIPHWSFVQWSVETYNKTLNYSKEKFKMLKNTLIQKARWLGILTPSRGTMESSADLESLQAPHISSSSPTDLKRKKPMTMRQIAIYIMAISYMSPTRLEIMPQHPSWTEPASISKKLKKASVTKTWPQASAVPIRHIQFSPDNKYLVVLSQDQTWAILKVESSNLDTSSWSGVTHPKNGLAEQVAWSPDGRLIITKHNRSIKIWAKNGTSRNLSRRRRFIQSVVWMPESKGLLSVETYSGGSEVIKLALTGRDIATYEFSRIALHSVAVTSDFRQILGVGELLRSSGGFRPSKSNLEKRIILYSTVTKAIVSQLPLFNNVCDVTIGCSPQEKQIALVSYKNKSAAQLWELGPVKDKHNREEKDIYLSLIHTYMPKVPADCAGPSHFGGDGNQLVLCATNKGDIYFWHRESGTLLHDIEPRSDEDNITCISFNYLMQKGESFMFATGAQDGSICIWTEPKPIVSPRDRLVRSTNWVDQDRADPSFRLPLVSSISHSTYSNLRTESPIELTTHQYFEPLSTPAKAHEVTINRLRRAVSLDGVRDA